MQTLRTTVTPDSARPRQLKAHESFEVRGLSVGPFTFDGTVGCHRIWTTTMGSDSSKLVTVWVLLRITSVRSATSPTAPFSAVMNIKAAYPGGGPAYELGPVTVNVEQPAIGSVCTFIVNASSVPATNQRHFDSECPILHEISLELGPHVPTANPHHLLSTINDTALSDCSLLPKDAKLPIHLSRVVLSHGSPFFAALFRGAWADAANKGPIAFSWPTKAVIPCILTVYSGWLPTQPISDVETVKTLLVTEIGEESLDAYSTEDWVQVKELASMLELDALVWAVDRVLGDSYVAESGKVAAKYFQDAQAEKQ